MLTVCSFFVDRRADYPDAVDYLPLLHALEMSCRRLGIQHVVLSDQQTMESPEVRPTVRGPCLRFAADGGLIIGPHGGPLTWEATDQPRYRMSDPVPRTPREVPKLPRSLGRATTEAQARFLEGWAKFPLYETDFLFVGADCLIRKDPRGHLPAADLSIILRPHKWYRINNGFMYVPAASVAKVAPLFRRIADSTGERMCDDMIAVQRALSPMPETYGIHERAGLSVQFLPMEVWNAGPKVIDDRADDAFVLHFRGRARKDLMVPWAKVHLEAA